MPTILHVDDSHLARTVVRLALSRRGFDVIEAVDGQAGLEAAQRHQPACVVAALDIPVLDGVGLVKRLRSDSNQTPVILVAACPRRKTIARCLKAGASDVIERGEMERDLAAKIERVLDGARRAAA